MNLRQLIWLLSVLFLIGSAQAATNSTAPVSLFQPIWSADLDGEVLSVSAVDLNGDGHAEVVADSLFLSTFGKSGTIFGLGSNGAVAWKYLSGLLQSSYTSDSGYTVVGGGPYISFLDPAGKEMWKRATRSSPTQQISAQYVYAADLNGDGKDEVLVGTSMGMQGNTLVLRDNQGNEIKTITIKGSETPDAMYAADINGDGKKEIMVGTIKYSPNTVTGSYNPALSKPTTFNVLDSNGNIIWTDNYVTAVTAVKACEMGGNGTWEVITGSLGLVRAYTANGKKIWEYAAEGEVQDLDCGTFDGNGSVDVVAAANKVYVLTGSGAPRFTYNSGATSAVKAYDLGGMGVDDLMVGGSSLKVLNAKGDVLFKSESSGNVNSIDVGNLTGSGPAIVFGSKDHKVRAVDATVYSQMVAGDHFYALSVAAYAAKDFNLTTYYGQRAKDYYSQYGKDSDKTKVNNLLDKAGRYSDGDTYYNLSAYYFGQGGYADAIKYSDLAITAYQKVNDLRKLDALNEIKNKAQLIPNAGLNLNITRQLAAERQYSNASYYAQKTKSAYTLLGNASYNDEMDSIIGRAQAYDAYQKEIAIAYNYTQLNDHGNATVHLALAEAAYLKLNDTALKPQLENVTALANSIKASQDVLAYGSIGVVVLILVLLLAMLVLVALYFKQIGGFAALKNMLAGGGRPSVQSRETDSGGGLRGLRGKTGESIGDSFRRR